jgi:hypothetical protein
MELVSWSESPDEIPGAMEFKLIDVNSSSSTAGVVSSGKPWPFSMAKGPSTSSPSLPPSSS